MVDNGRIDYSYGTYLVNHLGFYIWLYVGKATKMGTVEKLIKYTYVTSSTSFASSRILRARAAI